MRTLENVSPTKLRATNANEPHSEKTARYLEGIVQNGQWDFLQPVYALESPEGLLVIDGNNRRDFAEEHHLALPKVEIIENDADLQRAKSQMETAYGKIQTTTQLFRILSRRVIE